LDAKYDTAISIVDAPYTPQDDAQAVDPDAAPPVPEKSYQIPNPVTGQVDYIPVNSQEGRQHWRRATEDYYRGKQQLVNNYMDAAALYPNSPAITKKAENMFNSMVQQVEMEKQATQRAQAETQMAAAEDSMLRARKADEEKERDERIQENAQRSILGPEFADKSREEVFSAYAAHQAELKQGKLEAETNLAQSRAEQYQIQSEIDVQTGAEAALQFDGTVIDTSTPEGKKEALRAKARQDVYETQRDREVNRAARDVQLGKPKPWIHPKDQMNVIRNSAAVQNEAQAERQRASDQRDAQNKKLALVTVKNSPAMEGKDSKFFDQVWNAMHSGQDINKVFAGDNVLAAQELARQIMEVENANALPADSFFYDRAVKRNWLQGFSDPSSEYYKKWVTDQGFENGEQAAREYAPWLFPKENLEGTGVNPEETDPRVASMSFEKLQDTIETGLLEAAAAGPDEEDVAAAMQTGTGMIVTETPVQLKKAIDVLEAKKKVLTYVRTGYSKEVSAKILMSRDPSDREAVIAQYQGLIDSQINPSIMSINTQLERLNKQLTKAEKSAAKRTAAGYPAEHGGKKLLRQAKEVDWGQAARGIFGDPTKVTPPTPEQQARLDRYNK